MRTKFNTVVLPSEALKGLIHGFWHHTKDATETEIALLYIDVTERSASDALYAILKRDAHRGVAAVGYNTSGYVRGRTAVPVLSVVLSNNLLHVNPESLASGLLPIVDSVLRATATHKSQVNFYGEPGVGKIISYITDALYKQFCNSSQSHTPALGTFDLESNITVDNFVSIAIDPEFRERVADIPGKEFFLGENFIFMHPDELDKVVRVIYTSGKRVVMHPVLHRYYFDNVVSHF